MQNGHLFSAIAMTMKSLTISFATTTGKNYKGDQKKSSIDLVEEGATKLREKNSSAV